MKKFFIAIGAIIVIASIIGMFVMFNKSLPTEPWKKIERSKFFHAKLLVKPKMKSGFA